MQPTKRILLIDHDSINKPFDLATIEKKVEERLGARRESRP